MFGKEDWEGNITRLRFCQKGDGVIKRQVEKDWKFRIGIKVK